MKTITLAICTHNRADLLERFLPININALRNASHTKILVIDNGSNDNTPVVLNQMADLAKRAGVLFQVVREDTLGLSVARNKAIDVFDSDLLAFLDDDAYISDSWPQAVSDSFSADSKIIAAGGPVKPHFAVDRPDWLVDDLLWAYSLDTREKGFYNAARHPLGVNMIFAKEIIKPIRFSTKLGRVGSDLLSAEETVIFNHIFSSGNGKVAFIDNAIVTHYVDEKRLTKEWLLKRYEAEGRSKAMAAKVLNKQKFPLLVILMLKILLGSALLILPSTSERLVAKARVIGWVSYLKGIWNVV